MKKFNDFINESVSYEDVELAVKKYITESRDKLATFMGEIQKMDDEADRINQMIDELEPFDKMHNMITAYIEASNPEFIHFRPYQKYDMNDEEV
jgi:fibrillarin-like rRNA methylase